MEIGRLPWPAATQPCRLLRSRWSASTASHPPLLAVPARVHWSVRSGDHGRKALMNNCSHDGRVTSSMNNEDGQEERELRCDSPQSKQIWQWVLTLSYDGSKYSGWQWQPHAITIQHAVEGVLSQITSCTRKELMVTAASRTDAGVHAWGQRVSFLTSFAFKDLSVLHQSLNSMLPHDVRVRSVEAVHPNFKVRFHPVKKTYQYKAYVAPVMDPCQRSYALHLPYDIDVGSIQEAAALFLGTHNFSAFANSSPKALISPVRHILKFSVSSSGPQLLFHVEGRSFLYKQVRNMVGLLLEIGKGTVPVSIVTEILDSQNRTMLAEISATVPGHGLCLAEIEYDKSVFVDLPKASYGSFIRTRTQRYQHDVLR